MADTVRSKSDLINTVYQTTNQGTITGQSHRDMVKSVMGCYGGLIHSGTHAFVSDGNPTHWVDLTTWSLTAATDTLTVNATTGQITIPTAQAAGDYYIFASITLQIDPALAVPGYTTVRIVKNGTTELAVTQQTYQALGNSLCFSIATTTALVASDYVSVQFNHQFASQLLFNAGQLLADRKG